MPVDSPQQLVFPPVDNDPVKFSRWTRKVLQISQSTTIHVRDEEGGRHEITYLSFAVMGIRWNPNTIMWPEAEADLDQLTADAILEHCPTATAAERIFLQEDENERHFNHLPTCRKMQVNLRTAVENAIPSTHFLSSQMSSFSKTVSALDPYQGSRCLAKFMELVKKVLERKRLTFIQSAMQIAKDIKGNPDIEKNELHDLIDQLDDYIAALNLGGFVNAEAEIIKDFCETLQDTRRPVLLTILREVGEDFTVDNLRAAVLRFLPIDLEEITGVAHLVQSSSERFSKPEQGKKKMFSPEQQAAYISKLQEQRKTLQATNEKLRRQIEQENELISSLQRTVQSFRSRSRFKKTGKQADRKSDSRGTSPV